MTQADKELLLKDLCARLPYGVQIHYHWSREGNTIDEDRELDFSDFETLKYNIENPQNDWCEISWKPYLRSMDDMAEEERTEYLNACGNEMDNPLSSPRYSGIDWLNKKGFDYRGLIPMGLALEASKDMYKD